MNNIFFVCDLKNKYIQEEQIMLFFSTVQWVKTVYLGSLEVLKEPAPNSWRFSVIWSSVLYWETLHMQTSHLGNIENINFVNAKVDEDTYKTQQYVEYSMNTGSSILCTLVTFFVHCWMKTFLHLDENCCVHKFLWSLVGEKISTVSWKFLRL